MKGKVLFLCDLDSCVCYREEKKKTYNTRRCLSPAKSALVILVRLLLFKSLEREIVKQSKHVKLMSNSDKDSSH